MKVRRHNLVTLLSVLCIASRCFFPSIREITIGAVIIDTYVVFELESCMEY